MPPPPDERRGPTQPRQPSPKSNRRQGHRFPQHADCRRPRQPSTYGLTPVELFTHAVELYANGWNLAEIREVLTLPEVLR